MSSLVPFTPKSFGMAVTGHQQKSTLTRKERHELQHERDTALAQLQSQDLVQRQADRLALERAEDEAFDRDLYGRNRMSESARRARLVTNETDERIQAVLVPWVELIDQVEQRIFVRTFGR